MSIVGRSVTTRTVVGTMVMVVSNRIAENPRRRHPRNHQAGIDDIARRGLTLWNGLLRNGFLWNGIAL